MGNSRHIAKLWVTAAALTSAAAGAEPPAYSPYVTVSTWTTAVAAFPDAPRERPATPQDPAAELLAANPYDDDLTRLKIARNLYGGDIDWSDPYEGVASEDPYEQELELANPYVGMPSLEDPYRASVRFSR